MYFLTPKLSWHYSCEQAEEAGWLTSPVNPEIAIAAMCVGEDCNNGDPCTLDTWNPSLGQCVHQTAPDGAVCSPDLCAPAACQSGVCLASPAPDCEDQNPCTTETCDSLSGECDQIPLPDQSPCGEDLICIDGECIEVDFPPTAPVVQIEPEDPVDSDELYCEITTESEDPNGDAITYRYQWYLDGVPLPEESTSHLSSSLTTPCDSWRCVVTPLTESAQGPTGQDEVSISSEDICLSCPTPQDQDGDGVEDNQDNCPLLINPDQSDVDGDNLGDPCDLCWLDGDGTYQVATALTNYGLHIQNLSLNGQGPQLAHLATNASLNIQFDYSIIGANCDYCPGCTTQYALGFSPAHVCVGPSEDHACFYSGDSGCAAPVDDSAEFTLTTPHSPGMYFLTPKRSWHYTCEDAMNAGWMVAPIDPSIAIAAICVGESCDDGNPCTNGTWNPSTAQCQQSTFDDDTPCSDDPCHPALCEGGVCLLGAPVNCDDTNPCTTDSCLSMSGQCDNIAVPDDTPCGEGLVCIAGDCMSSQTDL